MRSPAGASARILSFARRGAVTLVSNVALALEYEATCLLAEHRLAAELTLEEATLFVDSVIAMCDPVGNNFLWRPQLRDPADEFVLEAAVNGQARAIVTFNRRDFGNAAARFGAGIWLPSETLGRIGK